MGATLETVDAILKEIYGPRIVDQLQNETVAIKRLEKSSDNIVETVGGKYVNFPLKVGRNHGQGYRNENEQLPAAKRQKYNEVVVKLKYGYGRVRLTGQVMTLAEKNYQSFASAMDREMEGIKDDLVKDTNRIAYGDGTGLLATVNDTSESDEIVVDDSRLLEEGMQVDVLVKANGNTVQLDTEVLAVNSETHTITFADSFQGTDTGTIGIYRQGSFEREPNGLGNIVADGELHGLDSEDQRKWQAIIQANGGTPRALSEGLMIETADKVRQNGGKTTLILGSLGVRRAYFNLLTQQRRYTDTKKFEGGFTGLAFNYGTEIPMVEDPDAPPNIMHMLDEKEMRIHHSKDWHWAEEDGNILKWVTNFDAFEAVMRKYWEIGCQRRNAQAKIVDLIEG
jgi:hypothetical protein